MAFPWHSNESVVQRYLARASSGRPASPGCRVEVPVHGRNSEVFLISDAAGARSVLRGFKSARECRQYFALMQRFAGRGLPLPDVLWNDTGLVTRLRTRRSFCAEEFVEGPLFLEVASQESAVLAVLRALAHLHDECSGEWGEPERPRRGDIRRQLLSEARRWIKQMPAGPLLKDGDRARWDALLQASAEALPPQSEFSLIHGKLGADDIVVPPGGSEAVFIDNGSLSFGHFAHDLPYLLEYVALDDPARRQKLVEHYLAMRKQLPADFDYAQIEPFFTARHYVKKLWAARRRRSSEAVAAHPHMQFYYESLCELARNV